MRVFSVDGSLERELEVPGIGGIEAFDASSVRLVFRKAEPGTVDQNVAPYTMTLLGPEGNEEQRWALSAAEYCDGVFADESGKRFCVSPESLLIAKRVRS
jgi:hypothetical protein